MTPDTVPDLATRLANAIDGARGGATVVIWRDDAERIKVALAAHPSPALELWATDLTSTETERLARALVAADYMNWQAHEVAEKIAGTVRAIAAARLTENRNA